MQCLVLMLFVPLRGERTSSFRKAGKGAGWSKGEGTGESRRPQRQRRGQGGRRGRERGAEERGRGQLGGGKSSLQNH
eukprot:3937737-Rhodomonas_salina.2